MIKFDRNCVLTGLAAASLLSSFGVLADMPDVTHPENTSVDIEQSSKYQGKISWQRYLDYWVDKKLPEPVNGDDHVCGFRFVKEKPFENAGDMREALWFGHDCPADLFEDIGMGGYVSIALTMTPDV